MKKLFYHYCIFLCVTLINGYASEGLFEILDFDITEAVFPYEMTMTIKSETGEPLKEAEVTVYTEKPGLFGGVKANRTEFSPDKAGNVKVRLRANGEKFTVKVACKGYHMQKIEPIIYSYPQTTWTLPETHFDVVLMKRENDRPLIYHNDFIRVYWEKGTDRKGLSSGIDLILADTVGHGHHGVFSDFTIETVGEKIDGQNYINFRMKFTHPDSGIIAVQDTAKGQVLSREVPGKVAPLEGYKNLTEHRGDGYPKIRFVDTVKEFKSITEADVAPKGFWVRIYRKDKGYFYGKIILAPRLRLTQTGNAGSLHMRYQLSPVPNEISVEGNGQEATHYEVYEKTFFYEYYQQYFKELEAIREAGGDAPIIK